MMEQFFCVVRRLTILLCAALFLAGAMWNLYNPASQEQEELTETAIEVAPALSPGQTDMPDLIEEKDEKADISQRIARLRIARDASTQQLCHAIAQLETEDKQEKLLQYAELTYTEQRLEVLLSAKNLHSCLAVLSPNQANIIVPESILVEEYAKLYDLVLRNTDYDETQIILIPLKETDAV